MSTASVADPKNHNEAMKDDAEGWSAAERAELDNHQANGSFTLLNKSEFEKVAPGRRLVKLVWVYKRKRNGKMKARLCVEGCSQQTNGGGPHFEACSYSKVLGAPALLSLS